MEFFGTTAFTVHQGIGRIYMSNGVASFGEDGRMFTIAPTNLDFTTTDWSPWGEDNLLPLEVARYIENCPALIGALEMKSISTVGKGPQPFHLAAIGPDGKMEVEWINDPEMNDWFEANDMYNTALDLTWDRNAQGWNVGSYILNKKRSYINRMRRIDVATTRLSKKNKAGFIENIYLSEDWEKAGTTYDKNKQAIIPLLKEGFELSDLKKKTSNYEFAFANRRLRNSRGYYPPPNHWSAKEWMKLAMNVPALKNTFFTQAVIDTFIISISEKYFETIYGTDWTDNTIYDVEKRKNIRKEVYSGIDKHLTGKDNAYKSICTGTYYDQHLGKEIPYVTITQVPRSNVSGQNLPDSSAANQEIHFAVGVNTAASGAGASGGPYSQNTGGSNIRESQSKLIMDTEPDRREICNELMLVAKFNGWYDRLKKAGKNLTFMYVSNLLTTLDTGKSTKSEPV
jgi:hypothetical protein